MPVYSEKVMDHFMHPRNVGEIENPDGVGEEGNPICGDMMTFYIKVKDNRLKWQYGNRCRSSRLSDSKNSAGYLR